MPKPKITMQYFCIIPKPDVPHPWSITLQSYIEQICRFLLMFLKQSNSKTGWTSTIHHILPTCNVSTSDLLYFLRSFSFWRKSITYNHRVSRPTWHWLNEFNTAEPQLCWGVIIIIIITIITIIIILVATRRRRFVGHILQLPATRPDSPWLWNGSQKAAGGWLEDLRFGDDGCRLEWRKRYCQRSCQLETTRCPLFHLEREEISLRKTY